MATSDRVLSRDVWCEWHFYVTKTGHTFSHQVACPDLLRYEQIGEADTWRGRVVRAFFWLLRWWPT